MTINHSSVVSYSNAFRAVVVSLVFKSVKSEVILTNLPDILYQNYSLRRLFKEPNILERLLIHIYKTPL